MLSRRNLSGDPPETPPRRVSGGFPDILAKITGKSRENFQKKFFFAFFLTILSGFASDLAKKSGDPPRDPPRRVSGGSPDNFRRDKIAGPHSMSVVDEDQWCIDQAMGTRTWRPWYSPSFGGSINDIPTRRRT